MPCVPVVTRSVCDQCLQAVGRAASDGTNLVPPILAAVEARATVGEIADAMRRVFGEYRETTFA